MLLETVQIEDKPRRACPACGYVHFTDPKVGVGVLVLSAGRVLLVQRKMAPGVGKWSLPAGFLDHGDDPQATAEREVLEETNLRVRAERLLGVFHNPHALTEGGASLFVLYRARLLGGRLRPGDDAGAAAFFAPDELPELAFASTQAAIGAWLADLPEAADSPGKPG